MEATGDGPTGNEFSSSKHTKFRFKSKRPQTDEDGETHESSNDKRRRRSDEGYRHSRRSHRHHHRSRRRKEHHSGPKDDPSLYDDTYLPNSRSSQYVDANTAFQESLFDALADDEGAAYWEGVYGQPIHVYPNTKPGPEGELERMTDEEYSAYVRAKIYEKSHEHIIEERERREKERQRLKTSKDQTSKMEAEHDEFQRRVQESLKRGEARKAVKQSKDAWTKYTVQWEELKKNVEHDKLTQVAARDIIPWPVQSGRWKDVSKEEIERFLRNAASGEDEPGTLLKGERVKWHPDKVQQRFGEQGIDSETMKLVTAVFQVVDRMWSDLRNQKTG